MKKNARMEEEKTDNNVSDPLLPDNDNSLAGEAREKARYERKLEALLKTSGFGLFHVVLLLITGLATAADAVEIFGVSFVLPIADEDLDLTTAHKGYLDASIFIGMLIGGYLWGSLADVFGRKWTLISAMLLNGVCGLIAAFSPNFLFFLFFRLASGIGVGGSQPIVFSYLSEFFLEKHRGPAIIILAALWQPGIIYTALLAWAVLGTSGHDVYHISFFIGSLHFVDWRLFLIICTIPAFLSSFSLIFMTESPAFLYQAGKVEKLNKGLKRIRRVNSLCPCCLFVQPSADEDHLIDCEEEEEREEEKGKDEHTEKTVESEESEHTVLETNLSTEGDPDCTNGKNHHSDPFDPPVSPVLAPKHPPSVTDRLCALLDYKAAFAKVKMVARTTASLFGSHYVRATLLLVIIWFTQSFSYYGLQLWFPEYFKRILKDACNGTQAALPTNCSNETSLQFYQDTLYTALASLPGNIASALLINIIGGRIQLAASLALSSLCAFLIWSVPSTHAAVVGVSCVFSAVTVGVFGALDVVNMNIYDVTSRSTAFGVHSAVGRVGAILGNLMFGHLLDVSRTIPILIIASFLAAGAVAAIFLPPIYRPENRPPLVRVIGRAKSHVLGFWRRIKKR